jgi:O-antigen ligase
MSANEQKSEPILLTVPSGSVVSVCLVILIALASFGDIRAEIVPKSAERALVILSFLGLLYVILSTGLISLGSVWALCFALSITIVLFVQAAFLENPRQVTIKAVATCLIFLFLAAVPGVKPSILIGSMRTAALVNVIASAVLISASARGVEAVYGVITWVGWFAQKNYLGLASAVGCATLVANALVQRRVTLISLGLAALSVLCLIMSDSQGAMLWLAVYTGCAIVGATGVSLSIVAYALLVICAAASMMLLLAPYEFLVSYGDISSGRTLIWAQSRRYFLENPWLGLGFGESYSGRVVYYDPYGNVFHGTHNGFMAVLVDAGAVGLSIYMGMIALAIRAAGAVRGPEGRVLLSMIAAFCAYNLFESALDKTLHLSFIFFALTFAASANGARHEQDHASPVSRCA